MNRKSIAQETVAILERGTYTAPSGRAVSLKETMQHCANHTAGYLPDALAALQTDVLSQPAPHPETRFEVENETTLEAAARLTQTDTFARIGVLNFASAKNPGGGFLGGAQAQEESLARSSGLYHSLLRCPTHYDYHRSHKTCLYSDRMIYSPQCPVFRTDDGTLLETPYLVDFLTSPAPNAGAIHRNEPENVERIPHTLWERTGKLLALAASHRCDALILGAWGCGVFRNDPALVAQTFAAHLKPGTPFWARFPRVVFAVLDTSLAQATLAPFNDSFAARCYGANGHL